MRIPVTIYWKEQVLGTALVSRWNSTWQSWLLRHVYMELGAKPPGLELRGPAPTPSNPLRDFTDTDGGVYGVRFFAFARGSTRCYLVSPTSMFVWDTAEGVAKDFSNNGAVRGHIGFHAAWPVELERWTESPVDHVQYPVKALVKGYGDIVVGEQGWRSERMQIVAVQTKEHASEIAAAYPSIGVMDGEIKNNHPIFQITWNIPYPDEFFNPRLARLRMKDRIKAEFV